MKRELNKQDFGSALRESTCATWHSTPQITVVVLTYSHPNCNIPCIHEIPLLISGFSLLLDVLFTVWSLYNTIVLSQIVTLQTSIYSDGSAYIDGIRISIYSLYILCFILCRAAINGDNSVGYMQ